MKEILINIESKEKRCAILSHGKLQDLIIERKKNRPLSGNIYRGRVTNILHNIQSAFIDINEGDNGFIHISDILENTQKFQEMFDMEFDWDYDISEMKAQKQRETDISKYMKVDHPVLVQVVKEPIGSKGARLTSNISIPGRYLVLLPNTFHRGVSRKIQDRAARERLKKIIRSFEMPQNMGLICRTASVNAPPEKLIEETHELLNQWNAIMDQFNKTSEPTCLYRESDLLRRMILKAVNKKFNRILIDDYKTYQAACRHYKKYQSEHPLKIEYYRDKSPIFERFNVENEIDKAVRRKIWLPGGGYLYFDKTEAMTTVDVNSGRSTSKTVAHNVEESLVRINMEAAEEIARQLRIRNIGGLIICDFIDMRSRKNQRRVLDTLKEAMKEDSAKCTVLGMSEFGLVEMTRQRTRESLYQTLFAQCPYCSGRGTIKNHESILIEIERAISKLIQKSRENELQIVLHPEMKSYISSGEDKNFASSLKKLKATLIIDTNDTLHLNEYEFYSVKDGKRLEV